MVLDQPTPKVFEKYPYRPGVVLPLATILMFGGCGMFYFYLALVSEPSFNRYFFFFLVMCSAGFVYAGVVLLYTRLFLPVGFIELTEYSIKVPKVALRKEKMIFFSEVTKIDETNNSNIRSIRLTTKKDHCVILNRMFDSEEIYKHVRDSIYKQIPLDIYDKETI